ncbi:MAG: phosphatidate cytidylyltransferase [Methyloceanibacter sp.]
MTPRQALPDRDRARPVSKKSDVRVRIISAVVLAVLTLGAVIASPWTFLLLMILASVILAWEWGKLVRGAGFDATALLQAAGIAAVAILITLGHFDLALVALMTAFLAVGIAAFVSNHLGWSLAGLLYTALPIAAFVWLRSDPAYGAWAVLYVYIVAATTDTASYAAGRLLGGPKLAPHVSPQKTLSGFIVGSLAPLLVGYAFALAIGASAWHLALVSVVLALACQMGDLVESATKRHFGVKDMSELIPGHGGLFDRVDGLLLAAVLAGLIALRDPAHPGQALLIW